MALDLERRVGELTMIFTRRKLEGFVPPVLSEFQKQVSALQDETDAAHRAFLTRSEKVLSMQATLDAADVDKDEYVTLYSALQYEERQLRNEEETWRQKQEALSLLQDQEKRREQLREKSREVAEIQERFDKAFADFKSEEAEFLKLKTRLPRKGQQIQNLMVQLQQAKTAMQTLQALPQAQGD